jgi:hypothetical protein
LILRSSIALALGLLVGAASAWWLIGGFGKANSAGLPYSVGANYWSGDIAIGSKDAGPYTRARIARTGLLALSREEAIYFFRNRDDSGEVFREDCQYRISGRAMPARWWSVTLYAEDDFLGQNEDNAHSISASDPQTSGENWSAIIASQHLDAGTASLSSNQTGNFSLTLRLYNPNQKALDAPSYISFPQVIQIGCGEGEP